MVRELHLELDQSPIQGEALRAYTLSQFSGPRGDPPVQSHIVEGVETRSPIAGRDRTREHAVEVEYEPIRGGLVLDHGSLVEYLETFEEARVTEESMAQAIRATLMQVLSRDELFVQVNRTDLDGVKRSRIGEP